ncbi:MAG: hypothetical protein LBH18_06310, partial [Spirochaetaceae bacterium]|nr:hypothetical protein [Spirochaetaceae bacterium]
MKHFRADFFVAGAFAAFLFFQSSAPLTADDELIDSDFENLFGETGESKEIAEEQHTSDSYNPLQDLIMSAGFGVDASYQITGGYLPGWVEAPWYFDAP